jgi:hypothetical protein
VVFTLEEKLDFARRLIGSSIRRSVLCGAAASRFAGPTFG